MIRGLIATTSTELKEAYSLRYDVFFEEGEDERYARHESRLYIGRDDGPQSRTLLALADHDVVVGTMRVTLLREWQFIAYELYELESLAYIVNTSVEDVVSRLARVDRVAIASKYRGTRAILILQQLCEDVAASCGCDLLAGVPGYENSMSRRTFARHGYSDYGGAPTYNGVTCQLIYKRLNTPISDGGNVGAL
jgi:hypothetical protein